MKTLFATVSIILAGSTTLISQIQGKTGPELALDRWFEATSTKQPYEMTKTELSELFTPELIETLPTPGAWPNFPWGGRKGLKIGKFTMVNDSSASVVIKFEPFLRDRRNILFQFKNLNGGQWRISNVLGNVGKEDQWSLSTKYESP